MDDDKQAVARCPIGDEHDAHDWLPFPGSGLVDKGIVLCIGADASGQGATDCSPRGVKTTR